MRIENTIFSIFPSFGWGKWRKSCDSWWQNFSSHRSRKKTLVFTEKNKKWKIFAPRSGAKMKKNEAFYVLKRPVPWDCSKVIIFPFSHFRVSAAVSLQFYRAVAISLQFYRVETAVRFHCSFTEWKRRCVFTAVLPSENACVFTAVLPSGNACVSTAVLPSGNAVVFSLQSYRAKTPLRFHWILPAGKALAFCL